GQPLSAEKFKQAFMQHPDAKGACLVHLETSTTIANPIKEVAAFTRENGLLLFVDAVSSLGGLPVRMDDWGIDLCASATQKCLGAPPGLSPVAVSGRAWEVIERNPQKNHGWYLNLQTWRHYAIDWGSWHPFPVTMATSNVLALKVALEALLKEGMEARLERYRCLALRLRIGLRRIGMVPYTPDALLAPVLTAAYGPEGVPTGKIVAYMAKEHNIKISGGLGQLENKIIRIGHMSPVVSEADIDEVIESLGKFR
ncbi:alanine--glyoxylate aminotransferase family protein, partial [bacterium]